MKRPSLLVAAVLCVSAANASAQSAATAGRFDVGAGIEWLGQSHLGASDATETTPGGGFSTLFSTSTSLEAAVGFQAHLGVKITESLEAQAIGAISRPLLSTTITNDIESSGQVTATDQVRQYVVGGGLLWYLPVGRSPKIAPFATGNAAYLRQLHESRTLVVTGQLYRASGGLTYLFASHPTSALKSYGLRAEAGFEARVHGVAFDDNVHYSPWVAASLFARFGSRR